MFNIQLLQQMNLKVKLLAILYVDSTKHHGKFALRSTEDYYAINAFCDSDYAGDYETRLSTSGFII